MSDMNGTLYTGEPMNHPITKRYIEIFGIPDQIASAHSSRLGEGIEGRYG
jgi:hypothetical protein